MGSEQSKPKAEPKPKRRTLRGFFHRGSKKTATDESIPAVVVEQVSASPADRTAPEPPTTSGVPESKLCRSTISINAEPHTTEITTPPNIPVHDKVVNSRSSGPAEPTPEAPALATAEYEARIPSSTQIPTDIPSTTTATTTVAPPIQSHDTQQETQSDQAEPYPQRTTSLWEQAWKNWATKSGGSPSSGEPTDVKLVDELIKDVKEKKGQCEEKRWFKATKEGEKVFLMDALLGQLNRYAKIGDLAIQHHPNIVALAWSGFRLLLQVGTAYTGAMKIVTESLEHLVRILSVCDIYEKFYSLDNHGSTEHLNSSIVKLYESIIKYLVYAKQYLEKNTVGRILDSFFSELGELLSSIKTREQEVDKWANSAEKEASAVGRSAQERTIQDLRALLSKVRQPIKHIEGVVETIFKAVQDEKRHNVLRWLSDVQYEDHHSYFTKRRHDDTAGSGKTMLASMVIDKFSKDVNHHALAYFYCLYQDENRDSPESILRALVKQMCFAYPGLNLPVPVLSLYEERERKGHSSGPPKLEESEDLIVKLSKGVWQTTIVIDALDECNPRTRGSLFSALKRIVSVADGIKIFVTARNDGDIDEKLREFSNHYIHAVDNTGDINRFIDTEIERRCRPDDLKDGEMSLLDGTASPDLKEKIISTLKKKACGVFMWAHFQIIAICEEYIPADVEDALEKLPKDLDSTYQKIFERIDKQSDAVRSTAREVLKWMLCGEDTSPELIIQALSVKPNKTVIDRGKLAWTTRKILSICHNLVVYDETLKKLRFAHLSVQEFLERHPDFIPMESLHCYIAEILMTVLINYHSSPDANDMPELFKYSTKHWQVHVERSGTARSNYLDDGLRAFLKPGPAYDAWGSRILDIEIWLAGYGYGALESCVPPFWVACGYNLYDDCRYMLSHHRGLSVDDGLSTTELLDARMCENTVQGAPEQDVVQLNLKNINGDAPLSFAAYKGHTEIVKLLLETPGVDLNSKNNNGDTALSRAAYKEHTEIVKLLLETPGVDPNIKNS